MRRFTKESNVGKSRVHRIDDQPIDAAFRRIKPNYMGFHIWKLENDRIETVPADQCGIFHDRDTYIIYAAAPADTIVTPATVSREVKPSALSSLRRYVHFWLGAATTAERSGVVAYKVIDLDNHLGNVAAQYRESQHHESTRFLSYFKEGRIILSDQHADPIRLFEVRDKVSPSCTQRPVAWASFCGTSAILLQTQQHIFVWLGRSCGQTERRHALRLAQQQLQRICAIADIVVVDDGYEQSMAAAPKADWNQYLSFGQRLVQPMLRMQLAADATGPGAAGAAPLQSVAMKLYKCGSAAGKYRIEERKTGGLVQADLDDAAGAFIVDCGPQRGVWIWLGRSSQRRDKAEAMRNARGFVKKKQYDSATPVVRVINGHEPPEFRQLFPVWQTTDVQSNAAATSRIVAAKSSAAHQQRGAHVQLTTGQFDALSLAQRPRLAAQLQLIDDGCGALTVYKVHNGALLEIRAGSGGGGQQRGGEAPPQLRAFFAADCYVVHYAAVHISASNLNATPALPRCRHAVYLWLGAQSTVAARTTIAALAAQLHDQLHGAGGGAMLVRTVQSHEPAQLLQAFAGRLAIFNGAASDYDASGACRHLPTSFLLKVCGALAHQARAVQVLAKQAHITSRDCLVLATTRAAASRGAATPAQAPAPVVWVWCGQGSTGDAREMAKQIGAAVVAAAGGGEYVLALEGSEPDAFWQCLPDQLEIKVRMAHVVAVDTNGLLHDGAVGDDGRSGQSATAVLYAVSGTPTAVEFTFRQVVAYGQADLLPEDVFVLDAGSVVYVWLGEQCLPSERKSCWHIAQCYLAWCLPPRSKDTTVAVVRQGAEPVTFVGFFDGWDTLHWQAHKTVDEQRSLIDRTQHHHHSNSSSSSSSATNRNAGQLNGQHTGTSAEEAEFNRYAKYPLDLLRTGAAVQLPELVDPLRKEMHLTHDDFVGVFAMSVAAFEALPAWRKQELKKRHKLF